MNYQEFLENIETAIAERMPDDCNIHVQPFQKNNGVSYDGLVVTNPQINISPTIYLNPYYHRFLDGVSMDEIYDDILSTYQKHQLNFNFDVESFTDFNKVKSTIIMKLINYEKNKDYLKSVAHIKFLDLAIIFQSLVNCKSFECGTITIHKSHIKAWGVSMDELMKLANRNMPKLLPANISSLDNLVEEILESSSTLTNPEFPMYVLTNTGNINGATCIIYTGLLKKISEEFGKDLIIIPSSIYEVILIPIDSADNIDFYNQMIKDVNSTELTDEQILSDHIYYYSLWEDKIVIP